MTTNQGNSTTDNSYEFEEQEFEGVYGRYAITFHDHKEVQRYRIAVFCCAISLCGGLSQWILFGPALAWLWLVALSISLGLALNWIHIYLRPLHKTLQIFWATGSLSLILMLLTLNTNSILPSLASRPILTIALGPLFAALTGLGFKEFFCFGRPEAIGLTILLPIALLGHLSGLLGNSTVMTLLCIAGLLLLVMATRKFGMSTAADVGDKSVFEYMKNPESEIKTL